MLKTHFIRINSYIKHAIRRTFGGAANWVFFDINLSEIDSDRKIARWRPFQVSKKSRVLCAISLVKITFLPPECHGAIFAQKRSEKENGAP